ATADVLRRLHFYVEGKLLVLLGDGLRAVAEQFSDATDRGVDAWRHRSALRSEDEADGADEAVPRCQLGAVRASAGCGETVVLCAPTVLGDAPLGVDPASLLEPDERRVDGALANLQGVSRELLDAVRESPAVHRRER